MNLHDQFRNSHDNFSPLKTVIFYNRALRALHDVILAKCETTTGHVLATMLNGCPTTTGQRFCLNKTYLRSNESIRDIVFLTHQINNNHMIIKFQIFSDESVNNRNHKMH